MKTIKGNLILKKDLERCFKILHFDIGIIGLFIITYLSYFIGFILITIKYPQFALGFLGILIGTLGCCLFGIIKFWKYQKIIIKGK